MEAIGKYKEGMDMKQFEHVSAISSYNHNYYKGFDNDLLFGDSDDDNTTEWYLVNKGGMLNFTFIGVSFCDRETLVLVDI
jgi:hypothetical protein